MLACCDLGGVVRGRSLPADELPGQLEAGVGWVPANHALTPLGGLAEPNPFGSTGDLRLRPAADTHPLADVGVQPERFMPEFGEHQYEIPVMPADGIAAADRSVIFKEVVREIARRCAMRASFAPLAKPDGPGNGAHVHFSLVDSAGASMLYDPAAESGLSALALRFAAGILAHADALSALTAPSPTSA